MTSSIDAAVDVLRSLKVGSIEPGGTDLGSALEVALGAFDDEEHADGRTIVVFSDGEDHVGSWTSILDRLRAARVIVHSVAIGDPEKGYPVPSTGRDASKPAETRRSDVAMRELARSTGGVVVPIGLVSTDLGALFRDKIEPTARSHREAGRVPERLERFPVFLLGAIFCGLAASWPGLAHRRGGRLPIAASAVVLAFLSIGAGSSVESPAQLIARGQAAYSAGQFAEALAAFEQAVAIEPRSAIPRYDSASALFQLGRFPEAIARYEEARERAEPGLIVKIDYAIGNARLALGDLPGAIASYDACLASTVFGESADAVRNDAFENRAFAVQRMPPKNEPSEGDRSEPKGSNSSRSGSNENPDEPEKSAPGPGEPPGANPAGKSRSNRANRGAGGAGGSGQAPPPSDSPEARLDAALKDIKDAKDRRPPDAPPARSKGVGKDW
jgi:Ca-activated chloride channel family protein